jgi:(p)ppGpp synthase/HD superfamily hydrolase
MRMGDEISEKINWIINQHRNTNHLYDTYLPYEFHLKMVVNAFEDFRNLLPKNLYVHKEEMHRGSYDIFDVTHEVIDLACWGHDLIEDTRVSYNDVRDKLDDTGYFDVANIIYALTNEKGKNRKDRANDKYYEGIRNTPGAVFVKLCDRIANVQYSKMTKSRMFEMYKKENSNFEKMLGRYTDNKDLEPMFAKLENLLKS